MPLCSDEGLEMRSQEKRKEEGTVMNVQEKTTKKPPKNDLYSVLMIVLRLRGEKSMCNKEQMSRKKTSSPNPGV